jgi:hypothetical protein
MCTSRLYGITSKSAAITDCSNSVLLYQHTSMLIAGIDLMWTDEG